MNALTGFNVLEVMNWVFGLFEIVLLIAAAGVCVYFNRLSSWMYVLTVGFAGLALSGLLSYAFLFLMRMNGNFELFQITAAVTRLGSLGSSALVALGLYLVLRDLKSKFDFVSMAHAENSQAP
jgi:hypothetical protein